MRREMGGRCHELERIYSGKLNARNECYSWTRHELLNHVSSTLEPCEQHYGPGQAESFPPIQRIVHTWHAKFLLSRCGSVGND